MGNPKKTVAGHGRPFVWGIDRPWGAAFGRTNVGDIADQLRITRPAISRHLRALKDSQSVTSEKQGQEVFYSEKTHLIAQVLRGVADKLDMKETSHKKSN